MQETSCTMRAERAKVSSDRNKIWKINRWKVVMVSKASWKKGRCYELMISAIPVQCNSFLSLVHNYDGLSLINLLYTAHIHDVSFIPFVYLHQKLIRVLSRVTCRSQRRIFSFAKYHVWKTRCFKQGANTRAETASQ